MKWMKSLFSLEISGHLGRKIFLAGMALVLSGGSFNAHAQSVDRRLAEGAWSGLFVTRGESSLASGFSSTWSYEGSIDLRVEGGAVLGDWEADMHTTMTMGEGGCPSVTSSRGVMSGFVLGTDVEPILRDNGFSGVIISEGCDPNSNRRFRFETPITRETPPDQQVPRHVQLMWASCDYAFGSPGFSMPEGTFGVGPTVAVIGADSLVLFRDESLGPSEEVESYMDGVESLLRDTSHFLETAAAEEAGPLDFVLLDSLLSRADELMSSIALTPSCDMVEADEYFNLIVDALARLLEFALDYPERFSAADLHRLIMEAARSGLFASHAVSLFGVEELKDRANAELERRLEASPDCVDAIHIGLSAFTLGNTDLYMRAETKTAAICGG